MATHPSDDDDLVQLNTAITRIVKTELADAAWRRRLPLRQLVQQIFEDWLKTEGEKDPDAP